MSLSRTFWYDFYVYSKEFNGINYKFALQFGYDTEQTSIPVPENMDLTDVGEINYRFSDRKYGTGLLNQTIKIKILDKLNNTVSNFFSQNNETNIRLKILKDTSTLFIGLLDDRTLNRKMFQNGRIQIEAGFSYLNKQRLNQKIKKFIGDTPEQVNQFLGIDTIFSTVLNRVLRIENDVDLTLTYLTKFFVNQYGSEGMAFDLFNRTFIITGNEITGIPAGPLSELDNDTMYGSTENAIIKLLRIFGLNYGYSATLGTPVINDVLGGISDLTALTFYSGSQTKLPYTNLREGDNFSGFFVRTANSKIQPIPILLKNNIDENNKQFRIFPENSLTILNWISDPESTEIPAPLIIDENGTTINYNTEVGRDLEKIQNVRTDTSPLNIYLIAGASILPNMQDLDGFYNYALRDFQNNSDRPPAQYLLEILSALYYNRKIKNNFVYYGFIDPMMNYRMDWNTEKLLKITQSRYNIKENITTVENSFVINPNYYDDVFDSLVAGV